MKIFFILLFAIFIFFYRISRITLSCYRRIQNAEFKIQKILYLYTLNNESNNNRKKLGFCSKNKQISALFKRKKNYEVASQLFRSGTSIGANISEAQSGTSKNDFINKMNIALKEARETLFWLKLLEQGFDETNKELQKECEEITKILVTIIKNTKNNMKK